MDLILSLILIISNQVQNGQSKAVEMLNTGDNVTNVVLVEADGSLRQYLGGKVEKIIETMPAYKIRLIDPVYQRDMNNIISMDCVVAFNNIFEDIYYNTKPLYEVGNERNPVAEQFFKKDQWDLGFTLAIIGTTGGSLLINSLPIENKEMYSKIFVTVINVAEVFAVGFSDGNRKYSVNIKAPIFTMYF
jgi:hypothetical protein